MSLTKLVQSCLVAALIGCSSSPAKPRASLQPRKISVTLTGKELVSWTKAAEVLGIDESQIADMFGYKLRIADSKTLVELAGIYDGSITVKRTRRGYATQGTYNPLKNPETLHIVLDRTDVNDDYIVTPRETKKVKLQVYEAYANK